MKEMNLYFGFGLSYIRLFKSKLSSDKMNFDGKISASVDVTNTGNYDGKEIVQLHRDLVGSVTRPLKELKGFQKIILRKEKKTVTFEISIEDLKFYNSDIEFVAEPGQFDVYIGASSDVERLV
jgi:beta-glucosidase